MRKFSKFLVATAVSLVAMSSTAFAGTWYSSDSGWYWVEDDGTQTMGSWLWLDDDQDGVSECYYFNDDGFLLTDTTTPDGSQVNADGCWVLDGVVQTQGQTQQPMDTSSAESQDLQRFEEAMLKTMELNDFEAVAKIQMDMAMAGETVQVLMDMNIKGTGLQSGAPRFIADAVLGMDQDQLNMSLFYVDGYIYMDLLGQKMKVAMPYDQIAETGSTEQTGVTGIEYLQDIQISQDAAGNTIYTFVFSPEAMQEVINKMAESMPELITPGSANIRQYSGNIVVNPEGYLASGSFMINFDMAVLEETISYNIAMDIALVNPGQPVAFELPSTEGYETVDSAQ